MWAKKNECGQENLSVLSLSVSVDCGVWTVDYDSAVSGEPPSRGDVDEGLLPDVGESPSSRITKECRHR